MTGRSPPIVSSDHPQVVTSAHQADPSSQPEPEHLPMTRARTAPSIMSRAFDLLFPPSCTACGEPVADRDTLCPECWQQIEFIVPPLCNRLGIRLPFATGNEMVSAAAAARPPLYARARAIGHYDGPLRRLVHALKFHDRQDVRHILATWLCRAGRQLITDADIIIPVPLYRRRLLTRRYNQSALLAAEIARLTGMRSHPLALERTRRTKTQVGLTAKQRQQNVRGAFKVPPRYKQLIEGRRILLVDDVITTGATVEACTRALLDNKAKNIDVLAIALVADPLRVTT